MPTPVAILLWAAAAVAGWALAHDGAAASMPVYDHQVAAHLANLQVPPDRQEYFQFDLNSHGKPEEQGQELADNLQVVADEKQYLCLIGSSPRHNRKVLRQAVKVSDKRQFAEATLIIVGPAAAESNLRGAATPLGTKLVYVTYP